MYFSHLLKWWWCAFLCLQIGYQCLAKYACGTFTLCHFLGKTPFTWFHSKNRSHSDTPARPWAQTTQGRHREIHFAYISCTFNYFVQRWSATILQVAKLEPVPLTLKTSDPMPASECRHHDAKHSERISSCITGHVLAPLCTSNILGLKAPLLLSKN